MNTWTLENLTMTATNINRAEVGERVEGLAHLFEPVLETEPVSFEMESLQRLLSAETLYHGDLSGLIFEIAELNKLSEEWKTVFELAYEKIPLNKRIYARDAMVYLYCAFDDYETAAKFLPPKPYTTHEITTAMHVFLRMERFPEAEAVVRICREQLPANNGWEEELALRKAMESYYLATKQWDEAIAVWNSAKLSRWINPFVHTAPLRALQLHALRELIRVRDGMRVIGELQRQKRAGHRVARGDLSLIEEQNALKRAEKNLMEIVSPEHLELLSDHKQLPVREPPPAPRDPAVQVANLIASLEAEQRTRFKKTTEATNPTEN
jgi:tetratricopeptide (TPR) repeat protein